MLAASLKSLWAHRSRLVLSTLAVVLGVAFVTGSLMFTAKLSQSFDSILKGTIADVNVAIEGTYDQDSVGGDDYTDRTLAPADLDRIRSVEGVASTSGQNIVMMTYVVGKDDKVVTMGMAPGIGMNYITDKAADQQEGVVLKSGRPPADDSEVVLDPTTLERSGYALGDTVRITTAGAGTFTRTVVGTALWGVGGTSGASYVFFTDGESQRLVLDGRNAYQGAWVATEPGADPIAVAERVQAVLPSGWEAVDSATAAEASATSIQQGLTFVNSFLLVFAGIGLVVAIFLIVNTFSILVAQRSRELALFRALGASRGQVARTVVLEAVIVGLLGSTLGLFVGMGLASGITGLLTRIGMDLGGGLPPLTWTTVVVAYGVGLVVTVLAALSPARRAGSVPPVTAMTGEVNNAERDLGRRVLIGSVVVALGLSGLVVGLATSVPQTLAFIGVGALLVMLGVAMISPVAGRPLVWLLGRLYRAVFGAVGRLAEVNAVRQPRRTAATASSLMIGLALVTTLAVLGASAKSSMRDVATEAIRGDLMVRGATMNFFSTSVVDDIRAVPGVAGVHELRSMTTMVDGEPGWVGGQAPEAFDRVIGQDIVGGTVADSPREVMLLEDYAEDHDLAVGSTMELLGLRDRQPLTMTVSGIIGVDEGVTTDPVVTTLQGMTDLGNEDMTALATIDLEPAADRAAVTAAVERTTADLPLVTVMDTEEYVEQSTAMVDQLLAVIYALLGLAVVIAVLGIVNTLALSVVERTREIGLLRAVGLTRRQTGLMITLESVVIALLGSGLGVGLGLVFGGALRMGLAEQGLGVLTVPWLQIGIFLAASALVGVIAAIVPARVAGRMDVLRAIATE